MDALAKVLRFTFYWILAFIARGLLLLGGRITRIQFSNLPEGAFVLVSNHISHFDPPLLSAWFPRKIDWVAMKELFHARWSRKMFEWLDVIPIDRQGADRQTLKNALQRLEEGRVVGIFPEGGLRDGKQSMLTGAPVKPGAVMLAVHANCPIVPLVILGSERLYNSKNWLPWRRARIYMAWGPPIFPPQEEKHSKARDEMSGQLAKAVIALKDNLVNHCRLGENDLPHSPQQRMAEA